MRRADRAVTALKDQLEILRSCKILRLAMEDTQGLYLVPLSFGFDAEGETLTLYVHSAREGRKVRCMTPGCAVAFEADCSFSLLPGDKACRWSCTYRSVTGTGHAAPVTDPAEKRRALEAILAHQSGQEIPVTEAEAAAVAVFRIQVETISGKQHL